jgi:predicted FMN-binding regulatory protein PaiB
VHINPEFALASVQDAKEIVRRHPFATLVTADLQATHMPCLVHEEAEDLSLTA